MRNSWGAYWADAGYAKVMMHKDNLALETQCTWGVPSFTKQAHAEAASVVTAASLPKKASFFDYSKGPAVKRTGASTHVISPEPHTYMTASDIPSSYDVRNISGTST